MSWQFQRKNGNGSRLLANVRRERVRCGLSRDALAERAEIATRNLQKIEAGEINILVTTAFRIQMGLRCPWKRLAPVE